MLKLPTNKSVPQDGGMPSELPGHGRADPTLQNALIKTGTLLVHQVMDEDRTVQR